MNQDNKLSHEYHHSHATGPNPSMDTLIIDMQLKCVDVLAFHNSFAEVARWFGLLLSCAIACRSLGKHFASSVGVVVPCSEVGTGNDLPSTARRKGMFAKGSMGCMSM